MPIHTNAGDTQSRILYKNDLYKKLARVSCFLVQVYNQQRIRNGRTADSNSNWMSKNRRSLEAAAHLDSESRRQCIIVIVRSHQRRCDEAKVRLREVSIVSGVDVYLSQQPWNSNRLARSTPAVWRPFDRRYGGVHRSAICRDHNGHPGRLPGFVDRVGRAGGPWNGSPPAMVDR